MHHHRCLRLSPPCLLPPKTIFASRPGISCTLHLGTRFKRPRSRSRRPFPRRRHRAFDSTYQGKGYCFASACVQSDCVYCERQGESRGHFRSWCRRFALEPRGAEQRRVVEEGFGIGDRDMLSIWEQQSTVWSIGSRGTVGKIFEEWGWRSAVCQRKGAAPTLFRSWVANRSSSNFC